MKIKHVHDTLADRVKRFGMSAVGFRNSAGVITLNMGADGLAQRDLVGIAMFNGGTGCMVPFGGTRGVLGTNPMAYAIPTLGEPMVLDIASFTDKAVLKIPLPTCAAACAPIRLPKASRALPSQGTGDMRR